MELAEKIKKIRTKKGLSQKEVALSVGIDRGQYSRFENGKADPSLQTLKKIAKALEVKVGDLFSENDAYDLDTYNKTLVEKVRLIDKLEEKQKEIIYGMIDVALSNKKLKDTLSNLIKDVA